MTFTFEVKETDLMGRNGVITVNGRRIETPCLTPVIHPVSNSIPIPKYRELGFDALMTNSLIIYRRRRDEALEKGIHRMVGWEGAILTDSGGYQVLEYGKQDITPSVIAGFQSGIGTDLGVTLDQPTGFSLSRKLAVQSVRASLKGARETIAGFGESETTWLGPIQGGRFDDLVRRSARSMVRSGFRILALGSPVELMESYLFVDLVRMIAAAKTSIPYSMPLHLFGAGHPLTIPISVALGCDTFDSASYILFAKQGRYMTERGTLTLEEMTYLPCSCPACIGTSRTDLVLMPREDRVQRLALHNLYLLRQDVLRCREAISEGRLWDLVEERAVVHPKVQEAFLEVAKHSSWLSRGTPFLKERGLIIRGDPDLARPELLSVRRHLKGVMGSGRRSNRRTAILMVSEDEKPLSRAGSGERLKDLLKKNPGDVYKLHPDLGPYPAELEFVYPFTQSMTVSSSKGRATKEAVRTIRRMGYSRVLLLSRSGVREARSR